jgi:hypothetical protein
MINNTPYAPTLNALPHLGRAEAVLYLILYYVFGHIHPRYQRYIDAIAQHERLADICQTADKLQALFGLCPTAEYARPLWRESDLPDIYFALLFAWRIVRPRPWAGLANPALAHQIFPALEPG